MTTGSGSVRETRSVLYEWLSAAFFVPTAETASSEFMETGGDLQAMLFPDASLDNFDFMSAAATTASDPDIRLQELKLEYSRLFLGPPAGIIHPFESIYGGEDQLMTQQALDVAAFYREHGIEFDPDGFREPPDHIAVELEFLAMACAGEIQTSDSAGVEWAFIRRHLGQWASALAHDVQSVTQDPLYRGAALLLDTVVKSVGEKHASTTD